MVADRPVEAGWYHLNFESRVLAADFFQDPSSILFYFDLEATYLNPELLHPLFPQSCHPR